MVSADGANLRALWGAGARARMGGAERPALWRAAAAICGRICGRSAVRAAPLRVVVVEAALLGGDDEEGKGRAAHRGAGGRRCCAKADGGIVKEEGGERAAVSCRVRCGAALRSRPWPCAARCFGGPAGGRWRLSHKAARRAWAWADPATLSPAGRKRALRRSSAWAARRSSPPMAMHSPEASLPARLLDRCRRTGDFLGIP
jgi:hypothetical protein